MSTRPSSRHSDSEPSFSSAEERSDDDDASFGETDGMTIFQLSSGLGNFGSPVGVAIIRISGPKALGALMQISDLKRPPKPRYATMCSLFTSRHLTDSNPSSPLSSLPSPATPSSSASRTLLDHNILCLYFPGPKSFTGEDVVELHVHGNPFIVQSVLKTLNAIPGLRLADAGEFTRRAFAASKLDLTQVEGLADLLHARTEQQHTQAILQYEGHLGAKYSRWRRELAECLAYCEVVIDFAEDESDIAEAEILKNGTSVLSLTLAAPYRTCVAISIVQFWVGDRHLSLFSVIIIIFFNLVMPRVTAVTREMSHHLRDSRRGETLRRGIQLAIVGAPNAGKSTLLNALTQRDVAIVSNIPGTTRDVVEVSLDLDGWPVVLADTAGLRDTEDVVEHEGVRRAKQRVEKADVRLVVFDGEAIQPLLLQQQQQQQRHQNDTKIRFDRSMFDITSSCVVDSSTIVVLTKADLLPGVSTSSAPPRVTKHSAEPIYHTQQKASTHSREHGLEHARALEAVDGVRRSEMGGVQRVVIENVAWEDEVTEELKKLFPEACDAVVISCDADWNMQLLLQKVRQQVEKRFGPPTPSTSSSSSTASTASTPSSPAYRGAVGEIDSPVTNERQRVHLQACLNHLLEFAPKPPRQTPRDMVLASEQLRQAMRELGKVVGTVHVEELLDVIFNDFCIGK